MISTCCVYRRPTQIFTFIEIVYCVCNIIKTTVWMTQIQWCWLHWQSAFKQSVACSSAGNGNKTPWLWPAERARQGSQPWREVADAWFSPRMNNAQRRSIFLAHLNQSGWQLVCSLAYVCLRALFGCLCLSHDRSSARIVLVQVAWHTTVTVRRGHFWCMQKPNLLGGSKAQFPRLGDFQCRMKHWG